LTDGSNRKHNNGLRIKRIYTHLHNWECNFQYPPSDRTHCNRQCPGSQSENPSDALVHTLRECGARYVVGTEGHPVAVLLTLDEYGHYLDLLDDEADSQDTELAERLAQVPFRPPAKNVNPFETICASARRPVPKYRIELLDRRTRQRLDRIRPKAQHHIHRFSCLPPHRAPPRSHIGFWIEIGGRSP